MKIHHASAIDLTYANYGRAPFARISISWENCAASTRIPSHGAEHSGEHWEPDASGHGLEHDETSNGCEEETPKNMWVELNKLRGEEFPNDARSTLYIPDPTRPARNRLIIADSSM